MRKHKSLETVKAMPSELMNKTNFEGIDFSPCLYVNLINLPHPGHRTQYTPAADAL